MGTVHQTFTGDAKGLLKEMERLQKANLALEERMNKLALAAAGANKKVTDGPKSFTQMANGAVSSIQRWAAGYVSLTFAAQAFNAALEEQAKIARDAGKVRTGTANAQQDFFINLGSVTPEERKVAVDQIEKIRERVGFASADPLYEATGKALSGTGGNLPQALDIVETSAPLFRNKPEEMGDFTGAVGDISKSLGLTDSKAVAALIVQVMETSRLESLTGMKAASRAMAAGDISVGGENETPQDKLRDVRETAALFAGLGGRMPDPYGEKAATLTAQLVDSLAKHAPADADTIMERVELARKDSVYREKVMKGKFGAESAFVKELLTGTGGESGKLAGNALSRMSGDQKAYTELADALANATPQIAEKTRGEAAQGNINSFLNNSSAMGQDAFVRDVLFGKDGKSGTMHLTRSSLISSLAGPLLDEKVYSANVAAGRDPTELGIASLASARSNIINEQKTSLLYLLLSGLGQGQLGAMLTPMSKGAQEKIDLIDRQTAILKGSLDNVANKTEQSGRRIQQGAASKAIGKNDENR